MDVKTLVLRASHVEQWEESQDTSQDEPDPRHEPLVMSACVCSPERRAVPWDQPLGELNDNCTSTISVGKEGGTGEDVLV